MGNFVNTAYSGGEYFTMSGDVFACYSLGKGATGICQYRPELLMNFPQYTGQYKMSIVQKKGNSEL